MCDIRTLPVMYARAVDGGFVLRNLDILERLLSQGWRVLRVDVMPGLPAMAAGDMLPPTLVYVLGSADPDPKYRMGRIDGKDGVR